MKHRFLPILTFALLASCDPFHGVSAIRELQSPLAEECLLDALNRSEVVTRVIDVADEHPGTMIAEVLLPDTFAEEYGKEHGIVVAQDTKSVPPTLVLDTSIRDYDVPKELMQYLQTTVDILADYLVKECGS